MLAAVVADGLVGSAAIVSSFGAESAVLLHLVTRAAPDLPVLFLDTGKHFEETLASRDPLADRLSRNIVNLTPDPAGLAPRNQTGLRWSSHTDGCCEIRTDRPATLDERRVDPTYTQHTGCTQPSQ